MGIIGPQGATGQVVVLNCQRQEGHGQSQSSDQNGLTLRNLGHWLVNHGVPKSEINAKLAKFLLDLYIMKEL